MFHAYFILNASRDLKARVTVRATLRCGSCQGPKDGAGEILNTLVDFLANVLFRVEGICPSRWFWKVAQSVRLTSGRSGWVVKGGSTSCVDKYREVVRA